MSRTQVGRWRGLSSVQRLSCIWAITLVNALACGCGHGGAGTADGDAGSCATADCDVDTDADPDDPCATGTDNCSDNATCANTEGSFTCACNAGFTGDGVTCTDVNECSEGTDNCAYMATCHNTSGSFTCTCHSLYLGDGQVCVPTETVWLYNNGRGDYLAYDTDTGYNFVFQATGSDIIFEPAPDGAPPNSYYITAADGSSHYRWCWVSDFGYKLWFVPSTAANYDSTECQFQVVPSGTSGVYYLRNVFVDSLHYGYTSVQCEQDSECSFNYEGQPYTGEDEFGFVPL